MKKSQQKPMTRRRVLQSASSLTSLSTLLPFLSWPQAHAQTPAKRRLLTIFLRGGWDSHLGTDPVLGSRQSSGNFASNYNSLATATVSGKSNLKIGSGLLPLLDSFAAVPTAFVNGLFVEVSAHEIAFNYMLSAKLSLSRSREFPSIAALLGSQNPVYPFHVVLGGATPLGETRTSTPPLQAASIDQIAQLLRGPGRAESNNYKAESLQSAHRLLESLDAVATQNLNEKQKSSLRAWQSSQLGLSDLYTKDLGAKLLLTDALKAKFGISVSWELEAQLAGAFLALSAGLSPTITVLPSANFDTHSSHFTQHTPLLQRCATAISKVIEEMRVTADPDQADKKLIDTTTILITSEFVRTPKLNSAQGTDHWQSASAILLGAGVVDGAVIGATGADAMPLGWEAGTSVGRSSSTQILPEHLGSALLRSMGWHELANEISEKALPGLFQGV